MRGLLSNEEYTDHVGVTTEPGTNHAALLQKGDELVLVTITGDGTVPETELYVVDRKKSMKQYVPVRQSSI